MRERPRGKGPERPPSGSLDSFHGRLMTKLCQASGQPLGPTAGSPRLCRRFFDDDNHLQITTTSYPPGEPGGVGLNCRIYLKKICRLLALKSRHCVRDTTAHSLQAQSV